MADRRCHRRIDISNVIAVFRESVVGLLTDHCFTQVNLLCFAFDQASGPKRCCKSQIGSFATFMLDPFGERRFIDWIFPK